MRVFRDLAELPCDWTTVISIGNFDGVHRGHQHVLAKVVERARTLRAQAVAVTFDPHPLRVLRPESAPRLITPLPKKLEALAKTGINGVLLIPFTSEFSSTSPSDFARDVIAAKLKAKEVHEGASFHFGHRAEGNCEKLRSFGSELGFEVVVYPELQIRGETVSSSRIRQLLQAGKVERVRCLLGRPFSIRSTPARGRGYGTRYTVPTINLAPYEALLPANGVYVTCTRAAGEDFESVTNVGNRPTLDGASFAVETHLLNFHPIALDESSEVEITFLKWLRPESKWPSVEALREQIGKDVARSKRFFSLAYQLGRSSQARNISL